MLEAKNLYKVYNNGSRKLHVLRGIDLTVKEGEMLSIFGPSGAGKSTLLHLLGGLDRPSSGKVLLDGLDLYGVAEGLRAKIRNQRIGFVFQFYHLLLEFTALENVMMPALIKRDASCHPEPLNHGARMSDDRKNRKISRKEYLRDKAVELLESVGLGNRISHKPNQLSGGEQQRVAIARALINDPQIVFCDEPTGNLDSTSGGQICDFLQKLNAERKQTFIIVTHESQIASLSDRVIHIKDGQLIG